VKVVLLSGGGGGARFARGLAATLDPGELTVIGNVGDDVEILGLHVSPDLDSLLYTLAGLIDDGRGWGRKNESWSALEEIGRWGGDDWFRLGDRDLGLHVVRSFWLHEGVPLSEVTRRLVERARLEATIAPATDDRLRTHIVTPTGTFSFQEWFVARRHVDEVDRVVYDGAEKAEPARGVLEALGDAEAILLAPSNPYLSIRPILAVRAIREAIELRRARCVAVSPIAGGKAFSGPLDRMLSRMAGGATPRHVTGCYPGLIDTLVVDEADAGETADVELVVTNTRMHDTGAESRLAEMTLEVACT
jgi:LPPG:FO 2-phospho-L-lactate transferase